MEDRFGSFVRRAGSLARRPAHISCSATWSVEHADPDCEGPSRCRSFRTRATSFPSLGAGSVDRSCREVVSAVSRAGSFRIVIKASVNSRSENRLRIAVNHYSGALNSQISALFKWKGLDRMAVPNCIRWVCRILRWRVSFATRRLQP